MIGFGYFVFYFVLFEYFGFGFKILVEKIGVWVVLKRNGDGWNIFGVGEFEELLVNSGNGY